MSYVTALAAQSNVDLLFDHYVAQQDFSLPSSGSSTATTTVEMDYSGNYDGEIWWNLSCEDGTTLAMDRCGAPGS